MVERSNTTGTRSKKRATPRRGGRGFVPRVASGTPCRGAALGGFPGGVAALHHRLRSEMPSASKRSWHIAHGTSLMGRMGRMARDTQAAFSLRRIKPVGVKSQCPRRRAPVALAQVPLIERIQACSSRIQCKAHAGDCFSPPRTCPTHVPCGKSAGFSAIRGGSGSKASPRLGKSANTGRRSPRALPPSSRTELLRR